MGSAAAIEPIHVEVGIPRAFHGLYDESYRYYVMKGGRGGARSTSVATKKIIDATNARQKGLCAREYQNSIKDSVKSLLEERIETLQLPGWTSTRDELRNANGSQIIFSGIRNNVESVKSMNDLDWAWVEEAENISKRSLNTLIPTVRKPGSKLYFTYNPEKETSAMHQR